MKLKSKPIPSSEITPEGLYLTRKEFLRAAGIALAGATLAACGGRVGLQAPTETPAAPGEGPAATQQVSELNEPLTSFQDITHFNNFYEFSVDKEAVASLSKDFKTSPWEVKVGGLVDNPKTYTVEEILKKFPREERVYRMRCVEGWSMVIPWLGFSLNKLLKEVSPQSGAKFVRFETLYDPNEMPGQNSSFYPWPYLEGLRLDEAMHELTILSTGLYGKELLPQNGAPLRLVVPWKYGFKSIKSIVKIDLVDKQPPTMWSTIAPNEYGFYSNVNPNVPHPRWSQATERRIGEPGRRPTLMFNGYEAEVAQLYAGMDLKVNY